MTHRRLLLSRHTFICEGADILSRTAVTVAPSSPLSSQEKPIQTHDVGCIVLMILCTFYIKKNLDKGEPKSAGNFWMTDKMSSALWTAKAFKMTNNRIQLAGLVQTGLETTWIRKPGCLPTAELSPACTTGLWRSSMQAPPVLALVHWRCMASRSFESVASVSSPLPSVGTWSVRKL